MRLDPSLEMKLGFVSVIWGYFLGLGSFNLVSTTTSMSMINLRVVSGNLLQVLVNGGRVFARNLTASESTHKGVN